MELLVFAVILVIIAVGAVVLVTARPGRTPLQALGEAFDSARLAVGDFFSRAFGRQPGSGGGGAVHEQDSDSIRRRLGMGAEGERAPMARPVSSAPGALTGGGMLGAAGAASGDRRLRLWRDTSIALFVIAVVLFIGVRLLPSDDSASVATASPSASTLVAAVSPRPTVTQLPTAPPPSATATASATETALPTAVPTELPTPVVEPTSTPQPFSTPRITPRPPTPAPGATPTPEPTATPEPPPTPTPEPTPTPSPEPTPTPTPTPDATPTPTPTPDATPTPTPTPDATPTPTPTPAATPTPTPTPDATPTPSPTP